MSPLASYRTLFSLAGPAYVVVAFLGRLPLAMSQLGSLILVSSATGSYGAGGAAAGSLAVANAIGSPLAGLLADRIGQRPVVLVQSLAGAAGITTLVALAGADASAPVLITVAAAAGLVLPQVGPLSRVRWRPITAESPAGHQRRLLDAAFSFEGAVDEASFVLGPTLVGLGAVLLSPSGALLLAAAMLATFGTAFALHPTARFRSTIASAAAGRLITPLFLALAAAQVLVGVLFGATQTGTTVLATDAGQPGIAGLVHALLGVGSVAAGLATVWLPESISQQRRVLISSVGLAVLSAPLLLVSSIPTLMMVVAVLGFAVAPYMIGIFSLGERVSPPARVGTAMTLLAAATGVGYAVGSGTAGRLADAYDHTAAFAVTVVATCLAVLLALAIQRALARRTADAAERAAVPAA